MKRTLVTPLLATLVGASGSAAPPRKPDILVLFSDDHGYAYLGCHGSTGVKAPHIDSPDRP